MDFKKRILCVCDKLFAVSYLYRLGLDGCAAVLKETGETAWFGGGLACLCWLIKNTSGFIMLQTMTSLNTVTYNVTSLSLSKIWIDVHVHQFEYFHKICIWAMDSLRAMVGTLLTAFLSRILLFS